MRKQSQLFFCAALLFLAFHQDAHVNGAEQPPNKVAQSENFVVTAPTQELATAIVTRAEQLRSQITREWLDQPLPAGTGEAVIIARRSDVEDAGRTWPAADPSRPTMVWLTAPAKDLTGALLAHELTHVVLSSRFPGQLPPWANEGIASQLDSGDRKSIRRRILRSYVRNGQWPLIAETLEAKSISAGNQSAYAVASSLVEYLLTLNSRSTLLDFAVDGDRIGWDLALRDNYGIDTVSQLQRAWQGWVTECTVHGTPGQAELARKPGTGFVADGLSPIR